MSRAIKKNSVTDSKNCETILGSKLQMVQEEAKKAFFNKVMVEEISHILEQGLRENSDRCRSNSINHLLLTINPVPNCIVLRLLQEAMMHCQWAPRLMHIWRVRKRPPKTWSGSCIKIYSPCRRKLVLQCPPRSTRYLILRGGVGFSSSSHDIDDVEIKTRQELK